MKQELKEGRMKEIEDVCYISQRRLHSSRDSQFRGCNQYQAHGYGHGLTTQRTRIAYNAHALRNAHPLRNTCKLNLARDSIGGHACHCVLCCLKRKLGLYKDYTS